MSRKACTAQTYQTGSPNRSGEVFQTIDLRRLNRGVHFHQTVGINDNRVGHLSAGQHDRLYSGNGAGNAGVNGSADISICIADFLSQIHMVAFLHQRLTGSTDMLLHGDDYLFGRGKNDCRDLACVFVMGYPCPAVGAEGLFGKLQFHPFLSSFFFEQGGCPPDVIYISHRRISPVGNAFLNSI